MQTVKTAFVALLMALAIVFAGCTSQYPQHLTIPAPTEDSYWPNYFNGAWHFVDDSGRVHYVTISAPSEDYYRVDYRDGAYHLDH